VDVTGNYAMSCLKHYEPLAEVGSVRWITLGYILFQFVGC
jgi:hypothetical protein